MPKFSVTIRAIVYKTMKVEAATADDAVVEAHESFTVEPSETEHYEQETVRVISEDQ